MAVAGLKHIILLLLKSLLLPAVFPAGRRSLVCDVQMAVAGLKHIILLLLKSLLLLAVFPAGRRS
jgi:hypothetical protein